MRGAVLVLAGVAALWSGTALAADLDMAARPTHVTVFADGAMVRRSGQLDLPAGPQVLVVHGLPASMVER